ncbi:MAG: hypothetical protein KJ077_20220 [Anaerolineae bacterium]|nr:hypothetical protein [Anaerolineae bacterium]
MSCSSKLEATAKSSGLAAGVSILSSKLSYTAGVVTAQADRAINRVSRVEAEVGRVMLNLPDRVSAWAGDPQRQQAVGVVAGVTAGSYLKKPQLRQAVNQAAVGGAKTAVRLATVLFPPARAAIKVIKTIEWSSQMAGNAAGALSKTEETGQVMQEQRTLFFFKSQTPVTLWKSSLTPLLNRGDVSGTSRLTGQNIRASEGVMFQMGGKTWHRGTTVLKIPDGERTITHLSSLAYPAHTYYFNRSLSDEQAVGLATGQTKPGEVPGFVGQVSPTESLAPAWAETKRAMILAQLHFGSRKDEG